MLPGLRLESDTFRAAVLGDLLPREPWLPVCYLISLLAYFCVLTLGCGCELLHKVGLLSIK